MKRLRILVGTGILIFLAIAVAVVRIWLPSGNKDSVLNSQVGSQNGVANQTASTEAASDNSGQKDPKMVLAELYAQRFGVTVEEALSRLSRQDKFPELGSVLEKNEVGTFGGLWIQHEPEYKIVVAFTRDGDKTISKYSDYIPEDVAPNIEVRTVDKSLAELLNDQQRLFASLNQQGIKVDSRVDIMNNRVSIDIAKSDKDRFDLAVNEGKVTLPDKLKINLVDGLAIPN